MPTGQNWIYFLYVNVAFVLLILAMYYFTSVTEIKENWPEYRCNPMYMPLSDNITDDFTHCIQNTTSGLMDSLLEPITYVTSSLAVMGGDITNSVNSARGMMNNIRTFLSTIIQNIFGVFLNLVVEFQKITIGIEDLMGKMIGMLVTMMYIMDGSNKTMQSMWNGPSGQLVKALGSCFLPNTKIKLLNGNIVEMQNIKLGDILENGSIVNGVMKIDNSSNEDIYKIENSDPNGENIYVTGTHYIQYINKYNIIKYIQVKDYKKAIKQENMKVNEFSCLITNNHLIKIGKEIFWDWDDYVIKDLNW
jgi:hypothetical protein